MLKPLQQALASSYSRFFAGRTAATVRGNSRELRRSAFEMAAFAESSYIGMKHMESADGILRSRITWIKNETTE
jgi:sigma54-dependent transcription regulator